MTEHRCEDRIRPNSAQDVTDRGVLVDLSAYPEAHGKRRIVTVCDRYQWEARQVHRRLCRPAGKDMDFISAAL